MKNRIFWERRSEDTDPFSIPRTVAKRIEDAAERRDESAARETSLKYLWLFITDQGVHHNLDSFQSAPQMDREDWLNVIDEAAAFGAEWLVVYAGASLATVPALWSLCAWAQDSHGMSVAINVDDDVLTEEDREALLRLDREKVTLLAHSDVLPRFQDLEEQGVRLSEANIARENRDAPCTKPESLACVGPDGQMYSCGLVLGEQCFALGHAHERPLQERMQDGALPHAVPEDHVYPEGGCDGCPPLIVERLEQDND